MEWRAAEGVFLQAVAELDRIQPPERYANGHGVLRAYYLANARVYRLTRRLPIVRRRISRLLQRAHERNWEGFGPFDPSLDFLPYMAALQGAREQRFSALKAVRTQLPFLSIDAEDWRLAQLPRVAAGRRTGSRPRPCDAV